MHAHRSTDPRVHRSRTALETAVLDLIKERDLARITIRDITRRAGVNRSTFYEHYSGVDDLAAGACAALFDELIAAAPVVGRSYRPGGEDFAAGALTAVFAHVAEHARLYRALVGDGGSARVINRMHQRLAIAIHVNFTGAEDGRRTHVDDPLEIPHDSDAAFLAGALLGTILDWLRRGCPGGADEMSAAVWPLLRAVGEADGGGPGPSVDIGVE
ncbi:TetR/AcrR family transcriptional regulator [Actinomadura rugatobispora]|uniref:TetR/AcrR family transcriptional regulator n=1 Tax=Actinomadura rugatobispora TaxID=1994 RepID=A0ABW0ZUZ9_9ACTN|nr:TetR/AcrR family transcriptional regulator C-terminal domain-containing protein [Actinomadura rugatobispora]